MKCPNCGYDGPPGMQFCGMCGTRMARTCPVCSFGNPPDFRFCGQCGTPLLQESGSDRHPPPQFPAEVGEPGPPEVATRLPSAPSQLPVQLEGERRLATVILADVTGSTDLMERIGTEAWVEIMNRVFHILESEVYRFGGEVDQFRGDGLVAFFGATSAHEDDPERAVLAGLAMQRALGPYAAELSAREGIDLLVRVGVNTGELIVASVGDRRQYSEDTAMGEAVAVAARMETAAEPGTVLVSENTYRLVQSQFEWRPLDDIMVKGISHPIAVYRPLAPLADADRLHSLQAHGPAVLMIGRDAELRTLKQSVKGLYSGRGGIAIVTGDRGMGKSFLATEVRQHFVRQGALLAEAHGKDMSPPTSLTWLRARCRSYGQSSPYSMWLDLLGRWLGMREGESKEETRDRLRLAAAALWGNRLPEYYPYLATFLSLPLEDEFAERVKHLTAEGLQQPLLLMDEAVTASGLGEEIAERLRQQFFLTVQSWVTAMAEQGPLVLSFEDLHWADTASLELLRYCLPLCDHLPLLWLIMFRPDRASPAWGFHHWVETEYPHRVTTVTLSPLAKAQSGEFIDQLVGPEALPAETRALVVSKSEGNPYYIAELVRSLVERGVLVQDTETGRWRATQAVSSLELPDTLQSLLMARIDYLSPEERHVLQVAAVIGPVFWSNLLEVMADGAATPGTRPLEAGALKAHLTALQRAQLIRERGRVPDLGMEYRFTSALIRDAAYESFLSAQRAAYHLEVAEHLEELLGPQTWPQHAGALAYHYGQAGRPRKELFYTIQAAEQAKRVYANSEALRYYTHALELLDQMERQASGENLLYAIRTQQFEVLNQRREVFEMTGDFEAMWADAQALLPLARELDDDPAWMIDALLQQPGVTYWQSREDVENGIPLAQQALTLARELGDRHREMRSLVAVARQCMWVKDPKGWELAEQALGLARQLDDRRYEVGILIGLGYTYASGEPERSMEYLEAALPVSQALDDRIMELDILSLIGMQLESNDDYYRRLTECHEKQLRLSREIGHRPVEAHALMYCGQIQGLYLGDYEAGLAMLEQSVRIIEGMPDELYRLLRIAQIHTAQSRYDEALAALERADRVDIELEEDIGRTGKDLVLAIFHNALGDEEHSKLALEFATRNRDVFVDNPQLSNQYQMAAACEAAAAHLGLARSVATESERQAHRRQALESSQAALDVYQEAGFVRPIECASEEVLYRHSLALAANDHQAESVEYLQRAYDEMMRKHALIPPDTPFYDTYLENIPLHREIRAAYTDRLEQAR
jgi:class 3 adenylate cyclase/tetratricopeptide (TPR) repeat protein